MVFKNSTHYQHGSVSRSAVLLINLGTPSVPTASAIRKYLRKFLSDPRVIEIPRIIWYPILYLFILTFRPSKVAKLYKKIWLAEGSPLLVNTMQQASKLNAKLAEKDLSNVIVKAAMCYSQPDIAQVIQDLHHENVGKLLILPLYPQYSATTTGASFDIVTRVLSHYRLLPEIRFINSYHAEPQYIEACAMQIRELRGQQNDSRKLLFSFHGLPKANLLNGDPYYCHCHTTARLIAETLKLKQNEWQLCFQSRFGRAEWLKPYTSETLRNLPAQGIYNADVFCPGFAADCLETLEEIAMQNRDIFIQAGGKDFRYIPALNDTNAHIECLAGLVSKHTAEWEFGVAASVYEKQREDSQQRALADGAKQ